MDFLRIRQKARERALEREQAARTVVPSAPADAPEPVPADEPPSVMPMPVTVPEPAAAVEVSPEIPAPPAPTVVNGVAKLEKALRAELNGVGGSARDTTSLAGGEEADPLDEFFWREDETAPRLPDLLAASELPSPEAPPVRREWLTFRLGSEDYALEIQHVREVLKPPLLTEVPRAPAHILGVMMVRGEIVAVIDLRARLGLPPSDPGPRARVLVCDTGEVSCGVLVDSVSNVIRLAPSAIEPRPPGVGAESVEYIAGIGRERNKLYILLDAPTLLGDAIAVRPTGAP